MISYKLVRNGVKKNNKYRLEKIKGITRIEIKGKIFDIKIYKHKSPYIAYKGILMWNDIEEGLTLEDVASHIEAQLNNAYINFNELDEWILPKLQKAGGSFDLFNDCDLTLFYSVVRGV